MSHWLPKLTAFALAGGLAAAVAAPLSAQTAPAAPPGDPAAGEQLFYEHSFGPNAASLPLKIFEALPDLLPGWDQAALARKYGLLWKEGRALPIGFVGANAAGAERLSFNCSLCHTGLVEGRPRAGMPNLDLRMQEFEEDLVGALGSEAFSADAIMPKIKARHADLDWREEAMLRAWIMAAKWQLPARKPSPHRAGPGRFDLMQTFKTRLGLPKHTFNANMDIPGLFSAKMLKRYPRDGALGGDQDLVRYLIVRLAGDNAPLKDGKPPQWVRDLNAYLGTLEPPRYPGPIDSAKAAAGRQVFRNTCAPCHGGYDPGDMYHPNRVVPIAVVGTDPQRVQVWDEAAIAYVKRDALMKQLDLQPGVGIMPPSLRGVWATAPYLHNGSVPTVYDVLSDPAKRPARFFRGGDQLRSLDPVKLGLSTVQAPAGPEQFAYDTRIPGNTNQGHPFGMPLSEAQRMAVIEYLKTL